VASTARLARRQLREVAIYHLHDPDLGHHAPDTLSLPRGQDVGELARALMGEAAPTGPAHAAERDADALADEEEQELIELASLRPPEPPPPPPPPAGREPAKARDAPPPAPPIAQPEAPAQPEARAQPEAPAARPDAPAEPSPAREPPSPRASAAEPAPPTITAARDEPDARLLAELEPLLHQGRWQDVVELLARREPDPLRLSPRLSLLYAVALKESPGAAAGAAPGARPAVDPDLLGVRAVAALLGMDGQSTTALMVAKRVLRRRPLEWQREPPKRVSIVLTVIALALGTAAGLVFDQPLIALFFR
jgi:outer membrane biosynthesis protein TonB